MDNCHIVFWFISKNDFFVLRSLLLSGLIGTQFLEIVSINSLKILFFLLTLSSSIININLSLRLPIRIFTFVLYSCFSTLPSFLSSIIPSLCCLANSGTILIYCTFDYYFVYNIIYASCLGSSYFIILVFNISKFIP